MDRIILKKDVENCKTMSCRICILHNERYHFLYDYPVGTNFLQNSHICVYNFNVDNGVPDSVLKKGVVIQSPKMEYSQKQVLLTQTLQVPHNSQVLPIQTANYLVLTDLHV
jgi:hypothetical protein